MAANAKDGDAAELSEVQFTFKPSAVELSAEEEERLRTLTRDELQLEHLINELAALKAQETTVHNWRDTADTWISVLRLRGQLEVQAAQAVLDCLCGDDAVLQALSAAEL